MLNVEIRVRGRIDEHWSSWFEGLAVTHSAQGETVLTGEVADQAALYGILAKLRDLGLSLTFVQELGKDEQAGRNSTGNGAST